MHEATLLNYHRVIRTPTNPHRSLNLLTPAGTSNMIPPHFANLGHKLRVSPNSKSGN
jgi:hypothetical protein